MPLPNSAVCSKSSRNCRPIAFPGAASTLRPHNRIFGEGPEMSNTIRPRSAPNAAPAGWDLDLQKIQAQAERAQADNKIEKIRLQERHSEFAGGPVLDQDKLRTPVPSLSAAELRECGDKIKQALGLKDALVDNERARRYLGNFH